MDVLLNCYTTSELQNDRKMIITRSDHTLSYQYEDLTMKGNPSATLGLYMIESCLRNEVTL